MPNILVAISYPAVALLAAAATLKSSKAQNLHQKIFICLK